MNFYPTSTQEVVLSRGATSITQARNILTTSLNSSQMIKQGSSCSSVGGHEHDDITRTPLKTKICDHHGTKSADVELLARGYLAGGCDCVLHDGIACCTSFHIHIRSVNDTDAVAKRQLLHSGNGRNYKHFSSTKSVVFLPVGVS